MVAERNESPAWSLQEGDCTILLPRLGGEWAHACVCDPPYELGFMGKSWDASGVAFRPETWRIIMAALKPGAHLLAFGGTRTFHRMVCAIEDAGFEIRDTLMWLYGQGFPKSLDVSKAIDKAARGVPQGGSDPTSPYHGKYKTQATEGKRHIGDTGRGFGAGPGAFMVETGKKEARDLVSEATPWHGWGTALKPSFEPIVLARKPLDSPTVAANVLRHGTGAINVDACRIEGVVPQTIQGASSRIYGGGNGFAPDGMQLSQPHEDGRWPSNILLDEEAAALLDAQSGVSTSTGGTVRTKKRAVLGAWGEGDPGAFHHFGDTGGASRVFYTAKASKRERNEGLPEGMVNAHPTVKPQVICRWLVRLVCPVGGIVLDPFAGSGTMGISAYKEGMHYFGIELEAENARTSRMRLEGVSKG